MVLVSPAPVDRQPSEVDDSDLPRWVNQLEFGGVMNQSEVLSPSTETFDRGHKFTDYQHLASLEEYLLISQNQPQVEVHRHIAPET